MFKSSGACHLVRKQLVPKVDDIADTVSDVKKAITKVSKNEVALGQHVHVFGSDRPKRFRSLEEHV